MKYKEYFFKYDVVRKKQYDSLKEYFISKNTAKEIANKYGYTLAAFNSLIQEFKKHLENFPEQDFFFQQKNQEEKLTNMEILLIIK